MLSNSDCVFADGGVLYINTFIQVLIVGKYLKSLSKYFLYRRFDLVKFVPNLAFIVSSLLISRSRILSAVMSVVTSVGKSVWYSVVSVPGGCLYNTRINGLKFVERCTCMLYA